MTIARNSLLFRGIDYPPEMLSPEKVLRPNNGEGILWTTQDSETAQTYIPDWGGSTLLKIHWQEKETVRPDDGIARELCLACGGEPEVLSREWPLEKLRNIEEYPQHLISNQTFGRPMSWRWKGKAITWGDIITHLQHLGYQEAKPDACLWIKTRHENGRWPVVAADSRLLGSLVIFEAMDELKGEDKTQTGHDLLDPAYHHAAEWGKTSEADFLKINDYCQTENHGNVGHYAIGVLKPGIAKLRVAAILPAHHHEWGNGPITLKPSQEEQAWRRSLLQTAA